MMWMNDDEMDVHAMLWIWEYGLVCEKEQSKWHDNDNILNGIARVYTNDAFIISNCP